MSAAADRAVFDDLRDDLRIERARALQAERDLVEERARAVGVAALSAARESELRRRLETFRTQLVLGQRALERARHGDA